LSPDTPCILFLLSKPGRAIYQHHPAADSRQLDSSPSHLIWQTRSTRLASSRSPLHSPLPPRRKHALQPADEHLRRLQGEPAIDLRELPDPQTKPTGAPMREDRDTPPPLAAVPLPARPRVLTGTTAHFFPDRESHLHPPLARPFQGVRGTMEAKGDDCVAQRDWL
jgi:hypothetical protein